MMKKIVFMIIVLLCAVSHGAQANTSFVECSWNETTKEVSKNTVTDKSPIVIPLAPNEWIALGTSGNVSYYEVRGNGNVNVLNISGEVHLILCDDASLTVTHIKLEQGNTLHIHAQEEGTGALVVDNGASYYDGAAGIGGGNGANAGDLWRHWYNDRQPIEYY